MDSDSGNYLLYQGARRQGKVTPKLIDFNEGHIQCGTRAWFGLVECGFSQEGKQGAVGAHRVCCIASSVW